MCARTGPPPGDVLTEAHVPGEAQADFGDTLVVIIVDPTGLILTNAHVVAHSTSVLVTIYDHPNEPESRPETYIVSKLKFLVWMHSPILHS